MDTQTTAPHKNSSQNPATLGDVLFPACATPGREEDWTALLRGIAAGDQQALFDLHERCHRIVFTLMMRLTATRKTAEELTLDVFHDVWRTAGRYAPAQGPVLAWIMKQARLRAIDRLRFEHLKKRTYGGADASWPEETAEPSRVSEQRAHRNALGVALMRLAPDARQALEATFLAHRSSAEAAAHLGVTPRAVKTQLRAALLQLREDFQRA